MPNLQKRVALKRPRLPLKNSGDRFSVEPPSSSFAYDELRALFYNRSREELNQAVGRILIDPEKQCLDENRVHAVMARSIADHQRSPLVSLLPILFRFLFGHLRRIAGNPEISLDIVINEARIVGQHAKPPSAILCRNESEADRVIKILAKIHSRNDWNEMDKTWAEDAVLGLYYVPGDMSAKFLASINPDTDKNLPVIVLTLGLVVERIQTPEVLMTAYNVIGRFARPLIGADLRIKAKALDVLKKMILGGLDQNKEALFDGRELRHGVAIFELLNSIYHEKPDDVQVARDVVDICTEVFSWYEDGGADSPAPIMRVPLLADCFSIAYRNGRKEEVIALEQAICSISDGHARFLRTDNAADYIATFDYMNPSPSHFENATHLRYACEIFAYLGVTDNEANRLALATLVHHTEWLCRSRISGEIQALFDEIEDQWPSIIDQLPSSTHRNDEIAEKIHVLIQRAKLHKGLAEVVSPAPFDPTYTQRVLAERRPFLIHAPEKARPSTSESVPPVDVAMTNAEAEVGSDSELDSESLRPSKKSKSNELALIPERGTWVFATTGVINTATACFSSEIWVKVVFDIDNSPLLFWSGNETDFKSIDLSVERPRGSRSLAGHRFEAVSSYMELFRLRHLGAENLVEFQNYCRTAFLDMSQTQRHTIKPLFDDVMALAGFLHEGNSIPLGAWILRTVASVYANAPATDLFILCGGLIQLGQQINEVAGSRRFSLHFPIDLSLVNRIILWMDRSLNDSDLKLDVLNFLASASTLSAATRSQIFSRVVNPKNLADETTDYVKKIPCPI
ncbi:hypothetical protein EBR96_00810 [bacterium]|nr:hypothetical protein [bacterium]